MLWRRRGKTSLSPVVEIAATLEQEGRRVLELVRSDGELRFEETNKDARLDHEAHAQEGEARMLKAVAVRVKKDLERDNEEPVVGQGRRRPREQTVRRDQLLAHVDECARLLEQVHKVLCVDAGRERCVDVADGAIAHDLLQVLDDDCVHEAERLCGNVNNNTTSWQEEETIHPS